MAGINLKIAPRFVKQDKDGLRPFQRQTLEAIRSTDAKVIFVEAPVGAGKSYIIRRLAEDPDFQRRPIILTYPTKILMDAQVQSLKDEINSIAIWPSDKEKFPVDDGLNVFKYSSDSLVQFCAESPDKFDSFRNRGELIKGGLFSLERGRHKIFVTTPDVLWLIYSGKYRSSTYLQAQLNSAIVSFDEFHTYANLYHFYDLLENLIIKSKVDKVVLLSATPFLRKEGWSDLKDRMKQRQISDKQIPFYSSDVSSNGSPFNYPLNINLYNFKYHDKTLTMERMEEILPTVESPIAIIFDSIFRLKHLKSRFLKFDEKEGGRFKIREWSGMDKDNDVPCLITNRENILLLGTSAIEVGIDMRLKSLITEASNWASAIQRIGRVGRFDTGYLYLFVNSRDTFNRLKEKSMISRSSFEDILQQTLPDPKSDLVGGELFRGESFNFLLIDKFIKRPVIYSEAIFAMYKVDESSCRNFWGNEGEKEEILKEAGVQDKKVIKEIISRDKLFSVWGIVTSDGLKDRYDRIVTIDKFPEKEPLHVTVKTETNPSGYHFYRKRPVSNYLEKGLW